MYPTIRDMTAILSALATFAYVLFWLTQHQFTGQPHHYVTGLIIVLWLASLPVLFLYRLVNERGNHHGLY